MSVRLVAIALGGLFGFAISWGQFTDPDRIREMLLLEDAYLYVMMATAVAVGFVGVRALRRMGTRALVTGEPVSWTTSGVERRHLVGAAIFGVGWAVTDACPAPIAGQLAQGTLWSLFTIAGVAIGIVLFLRGEERRLARPATPRASAPSQARPLASAQTP
ncbi:MAG: YeeE/YedE family protein [Thermoleophilaceae bacterium]|nr:YeeE/YedE family protein [Thermoleophilaceae bacterium]